MGSRFHVGDKVIILKGRDKGKCGKIKYILFTRTKVIVEGINLVKKHQKPMPNIQQLGGIISLESIVDMSNIAIFNTYSNKPDKIKFKIQNGKKLRIFKSNGKIIK